MESLHSVTRCNHTPTPVHSDRERGMSVNYYLLVIECKDSKKNGGSIEYVGTETGEKVVLLDLDLNSYLFNCNKVHFMS